MKLRARDAFPANWRIEPALNRPGAITIFTDEGKEFVTMEDVEMTREEWERFATKLHGITVADDWQKRTERDAQKAGPN